MEIKQFYSEKNFQACIMYITTVEMDEARACVIKIDSDMGSV
jgi:hypothetical protein